VTRLRAAFLAGAVLLAGSVATFVVALVTGSDDSAETISGFHRVSFAQDSGTVDLDTGSWVGYFEVPGRRDAVVTVPNFRAFIRGPQGEQVNLGGYGALARFRYYHAGKNGVALFRFQAPRSGGYRIQLQAPGDVEPGADLAIGRDLAGAGSSSRAVPLTVGTATAVLGFGVLGWGFFERSRQRRVVSAAS